MTNLRIERNQILSTFKRIEQTRNYYLGEREHLFNNLQKQIVSSKNLYKNKNIPRLVIEITTIPCDGLGWLNKVALLRREIENFYLKINSSEMSLSK